MKVTLIITLFLSFFYSQNKGPYMANLGIGENLSFNDREIKFVKIQEDSRCPTQVTCVRAGEAKAIIATYEDGKKIGEQIVVFSGNEHIQRNIQELLNIGGLTISALTLEPYPVEPQSIEQEDYRLIMKINPNPRDVD